METEIYKNLSLENLTNEEWKDVVGYEGSYKVSNYGRVKSLNYSRTGIANILKPKKQKNGYLYVCLYNKGKIEYILIHRLVMKTFVPEHDFYRNCINHKDENKTNNCVDNLEWCTNKENNNYGTRNKRASKSKSKKICQYRKDGLMVKEWDSLKEAEKHGFGHSHISDCCKGKRKSHKGFIWKYKE